MGRVRHPPPRRRWERPKAVEPMGVKMGRAGSGSTELAEVPPPRWEQSICVAETELNNKDKRILFLNSPNRHPFSSPAIVHRLTRAGDESGLRV